MQLSDLKVALAQSIPLSIEIHAFEGIIYLVEVVFDDRRQFLKNAQGDNAVYKSSTAAGVALAGIGATSAVIVHQCAYDEVIGHEPCQSDDPHLRTPMDLRALARLA